MLTAQGRTRVKQTRLQLGKDSQMYYEVTPPETETILPQSPSGPGQMSILTSVIQKPQKEDP